MRFDVMYEDTVVAEVDFDKGKLNSYKRYDVFCMGLFYFPNVNVTGELIFDFLQERVVPPDRENIDEILKANGLRYYNVYDLVKLTHGVNVNDDLWIRFEGEDITLKDLKR